MIDLFHSFLLTFYYEQGTGCGLLNNSKLSWWRDFRRYACVSRIIICLHLLGLTANEGTLNKTTETIKQQMVSFDKSLNVLYNWWKAEIYRQKCKMFSSQNVLFFSVCLTCSPIVTITALAYVLSHSIISLFYIHWNY